MKRLKPTQILIIALFALIIVLLAIFSKSIFNKPIDLSDSISPECIKEWTKAKEYCMKFPADKCEGKSYQLYDNYSVDCYIDSYSNCYAKAICI